MQQVVASVGKPDSEPALAPFLAPPHRFIEAQNGALIWVRLLRFRLKGLVKLPRGDDRRAYFTDDDAGRGICQTHQLTRWQLPRRAQRG
jgi:hypothetical protein